MRRATHLLVLASLAALVLPASAGADAYTTVEQAYAQSGTIRPCQFSSRELEAALREAPDYDVEYFGDLTDAIDSALTSQAGGECSSRKALGAAAEHGVGSLRAPRLPPSATAGTGAGVPLALLLGLILAAAGVLVAGGLATTRALGLDTQWAQAARHSWREAEYRLAGTWAEFRDWLRG